MLLVGDAAAMTAIAFRRPDEIVMSLSHWRVVVARNYLLEAQPHRLASVYPVAYFRCAITSVR